MNISRLIAITITALPFCCLSEFASAVTLDFANSTVSGQPDDPNGMIFENIVNDPGGDGVLDLVILATSPYDPANRNNNRKAGTNGVFGQINQRNNNNTNFEFRLVDSLTGQLASPSEVILTLLDIDGGNPQPFESVTVFTDATARVGSEVAINDNVFSGTFAAGNQNNPTTTTLNAEQTSISLELTFRNTGVFNFNFDAGASNNSNTGRNIIFSGIVNFDPDEPLNSITIGTPTIPTTPEHSSLISFFILGTMGILFKYKKG